MRILIKNVIITLTILLGLNGCSILNFNSVLYDENLDVYKYPINQTNSIFLRNEQGMLINDSNIDSFKVELEKKKNKYNFSNCIEEDEPLKFNDLKIAKLYSDINEKIKSNEFDIALSKLNQLETIYPDIKKYSDCLFLKANIYEQIDSFHLAKKYYDDFINYSCGKYSARFRGYRDLDANDSIFGLQREYAKDILSDHIHNYSSIFLSDNKPKYYFNSFQPGFLLNPEDYSRDVKWVTMLVFATDYSNRFGIGYLVNRKLNNIIDLNLWALATGKSTSFGAGVPIQVYKSSNDRFGIKISPFASFAYADSLIVDGTNYGIRQGLFNFGAKLSCGYSLLPNLSLGAYYKYNFHNTNNPILTKNNNIYLWWPNEYDISLYYNIVKGLSFKAGVYNGDIVSGIFWSGWEISYNITNPGFVMRIDMN